jgi:hypothetical protein
MIRNDDIIKLDNYESFGIRDSHNLIFINQLLSFFDKEERLEIEIIDSNLLVKTLNPVCRRDFERIQKQLEKAKVLN